MKNLENKLKKSLALPKWVGWGFLILALVGFSDATFLTIKHLRNLVVPCTVVTGCETVLASVYSEVFGIPTALFGSLYYLVLVIGSIYYLESKKILILKYLSYLTIFGFIASVYLVYLQLIIIKAICLYCMMSALSSTLLFVLGIFIIVKYPTSRKARRDK